jgi:hypothetical protein
MGEGNKIRGHQVGVTRPVGKFVTHRFANSPGAMRALDLGGLNFGCPVVSETAMDERIEGFLRDVLALEGEHSNLVRESVRAFLANYERQFRNAETNKRMKDKAAHACDMLCRARVVERRCSDAGEH